ncbi:hypothetical protein [Fulvivirga ligni]|uniref:hypothetical protein n=1 Tax=Fulvivirga ligni TaxID=2904246 RepID=UPI001F473107|nr:hypothetical protein [Fulvivirga ligni]UII21603.1 hypothetical protein LVD16_27630 [Fulvivirga ligni]
MQNKVDQYYANLTTGRAWYESFDENSGVVAGYNNASFPQLGNLDNYLTITYYDNYNFKSLSEFGADYDYDASQLSQATCAQGTYQFPAAALDRVKGQVTGAMTKVLDNNIWLGTVSYYDDKYRSMQAISDNYVGGKDIVSNIYNFSGWVLKKKASHITATDTEVTELAFIYNHAGLLIDTWHSINEEDSILLAHNEYNELGETH